MSLSTRHLLGIKDLTVDDISLILNTAEQFKEVLQRPVKKVPSLRDVTIVNLFYENSTRTRFSFELAEKRLSADTINFAVSGSSLPANRSNSRKHLLRPRRGRRPRSRRRSRRRSQPPFPRRNRNRLRR